MFKKFKEWLIWLFSKRVGEAINGDATYEEVEAIVMEELTR